MKNSFETLSHFIKEENKMYFFRFGKYGWIVKERENISETPEYLGGNKAMYEMFPIEWMNDNDWKVALEKFPSFLGVITYLTEVNAVKLMVLLKEEITEYYSKEGI